MIPTTVWMDFTGVYADRRCADEKRRAGREGREIYCSCRDISGTNCYCDEDAAGELCARMSGYPAEGLHFIDSGNYHYVSRLWLSFIEEPCQLLVFDNHTDMQPPAFGGLLSCGGWIADAAGSLSELERVLLAGPDEEAFEAAEPESRAKVRLLSREKLSEARREGRLPGLFREWCSQHLTGHPLYLSIDKDVLSPDFARTGWSQGDLRLGLPAKETCTPDCDRLYPDTLEILIHQCGGREEAISFAGCTLEGKNWYAREQTLKALQEGISVSVVWQQRVESTIPTIYKNHGYVFGPYSALCYAGLMDYRSRTGSGNFALIPSERGALRDDLFVAREMNMAVSTLHKIL